ncbi:MAG: Tad secretion system ATPase TadA [Idiomarinaceae bacterium HL-53]|nr:MAG: Tad secretion system ATPase TadA [Idiomarinaceae bacterium HL-53]CUS48808.1 pilus assembly protein CpaF [Idiomarinaceae bacterium HL-53]
MDVYEEIRSRAFGTMDMHRARLEEMDDSAVRDYLVPLLDPIIQTVFDQRLSDSLVEPNEIFRQKNEIRSALLDDILGLGPLEVMLRDSSISEIMVNRHDQIFVERAGLIEHYPLTLECESKVRHLIDRIVTPLGRRIDESSPMVDARLPCGSRVNAVIPPLAIDGSCLTIRKFSEKRIYLEDLISWGTCSPEAGLLLSKLVVNKSNIVVSGGTGSGKTTLLNILASLIPEHERIITVEDAAELSIQHRNRIRLEARPPNQEGQGAIVIRELIVNALRMRPDRILVGECRSGECLDMLQAMNTGHNGSMTTVHANSPRDALSRLETLVLMAGVELPLIAVKQQIASAIHWIIQIARVASGHRRIVSITELQGLEDDVIQMAEVFKWSNTHEALIPTGEMPSAKRFTSETDRDEILQSIYGFAS